MIEEGVSVSDALISLAPDKEWVVRDGTEIEWLDPDSKPPTRKQIEKEIARLKSERDNCRYQSLRRAEYPPIEEFADAMYWLRKGDSVPMEEYEAKVSAVKNKFPKPFSAS